MNTKKIKASIVLQNCFAGVSTFKLGGILMEIIKYFLSLFFSVTLTYTDTHSLFALACTVTSLTITIILLKNKPTKLWGLVDSWFNFLQQWMIWDVYFTHTWSVARLLLNCFLLGWVLGTRVTIPNKTQELQWPSIQM